jgi:Ca2+-binding EF-hand superfamily protein
VAHPPTASRATAAASLGVLALLVVAPRGSGAPESAPPALRGAGERDAGCLTCHAGIEDMHPGADLSCTDCHGGDGAALSKSLAHVRAPSRDSGDERVPALDEDLPWRRFKNPMDLRVVSTTCGDCHAQLIEHLRTSLHGTTAGHLSDGYYEMGLVGSVGSRYAVFPTKAGRPGGEVEALTQPPPFSDRLNVSELRTHFTDLVRKECMQCHLWSEGRAVQGRVGFDGDYRGEGCAACHVAYTLDGLSSSADPSVPKNEPGHPVRHTLQRAPTTQTCTACHYGDASIGLAFRGLSQLPPGAPGGPNIPGTTDRPLNREFYLSDPEMTPPDVHHESGMHCVDCHTLGDVMGDGFLHGQMEHAVEISCQACHGTFARRTDLRTERGTPLAHVRDDGTSVILTSKVDGREHRVPQAVDVLDPSHADYNPRAAEAMTPQHADVECYTCHAAWNVNFLGFHFSRNESLTQLDLLSGKRTPGRVTTQEKVFSTWKGFYAGRNEAGRIAPYMTGFSTMGSVWDANGELVIDQAMPVTEKGLSGLTMVHHQVHTTRPTARSCVECHRSSTTWGLGSLNFRLARQLAFVADRRGIEVVALDRGQITASPPLGKLVLPDVVAIAPHCDDLQGRAHHLYATEGGRGVHVIDVRDPAKPRRVAFLATINPREMHLAGDYLYLADGIGGLRILDVSVPEKIHEVGHVPMFDAHDVQVQWPYAYVADGPGGLAIIDVRAPIAPRFVSAFDLNLEDDSPNQAAQVAVMFQNSRPIAIEGKTTDRRTPARNIAAVLDLEQGLYLVDVTEPTRPEVLFPSPGFLRSDRSRGGRGRRGDPNLTNRGMVFLSHVDLAEAQGGDPTRERDYVFVTSEVRLRNGMRRSVAQPFDVTDPTRPRVPPAGVEVGFATEMLAAAQIYNQPFLQTYLFSPGELGVFISDFTTTHEPKQAGTLPGLIAAYAIAFEEFPLDRTIDEMGRPLKDVSHPASRWLYRTEIERILAVPGAALGTVQVGTPAHDSLGLSARLHLGRLDADGSGLLEGDEAKGAGAGTFDRDGDGRIALIELAAAGGMLRSSGSAAPDAIEPAFLVTRVDADGDLSRLLDGTDPYAFDRDADDRLDRAEMERAFFHALDLDGDERLSLDELSRHPGDLRGLRYRDAIAQALFREVDRNKDGRVSGRELKLRDADWEALDVDRDGGVQLPISRLVNRRGAGTVEPKIVEWPYRRAYAYPLPPTISREAFYAAFDADGDERITKREMKAREDLFLALDLDGSGVLDETEITPVLTQIGQLGVDATVDEFQRRWDLDGDGQVEAAEIPNAPVLRARGVIGPGR